MKTQAEIDAPAFPSPTGDYEGGPRFGATGMTLRDYFAAQAITGFLRQADAGFVRAADVAEEAYKLADAMLKARQA